MPRLLSYLIEATREEILAFGTRVPIRSGDSLDAGNTNPTTISLTRQLNKALKDLAITTKFSQKVGTVALVAGQRPYTLPSGWLDILAVRHPQIRLRRTTEGDIDKTEPDWNSLASSDTLYRYFVRGTAQIVLVEAPSATAVTAGANLSVTYVANPADMSVAASDSPELLPDIFHDYLPVGAALFVCNMDSGNPKAVARKPYLEGRWNDAITALQTLMRDRLGDDQDATFAHLPDVPEVTGGAKPYPKITA